MRTRRMIYWWFRFIVSGRLFETFLNLRYDAIVTKLLDSGPARSGGRQ
jgi:hypothetical protein